MSKSKRVLLFGDSHSGHVGGLTSPKFRITPADIKDSTDPNLIEEYKIRNALYENQKMAWDFWTNSVVNAIGEVDVAIANGDLVEGLGTKSAGMELLTTNPNTQVMMALDVLNKIRTKNYVIIRGTPYHTGTNTDYEDTLARELRKLKHVKSVIVADHQCVNINGIRFDCKHKIERSNVPHGRFTALAREAIWDILKAYSSGDRRADVIIRSHVHYHLFCGGIDMPLVMTLPGLQLDTRFGSRECTGSVHFGVVKFDIDASGAYTWEPITAKIKKQKLTEVNF